MCNYMHLTANTFVEDKKTTLPMAGAYKEVFLKWYGVVPLRGCTVSIIQAGSLTFWGLRRISSMICTISCSVGRSISPTAVK